LLLLHPSALECLVVERNKNVGVALEEIYHDMIELDMLPEKSSLEEEK
jgi:DNA-directed RNA polymerase subunit K/omega